MICPKCEEGVLGKICFKNTGKIAYLCDTCRSYWLEDEHIDITTGHTLEEEAKDTFVYVSEKDEESERNKEDEEAQDEREQYELS